MAGNRSYRTVVGEVDDVAWCDIFNRPAYCRLHRHERDFYFRLLSESSGSLAGVAHFSEVEPGLFRSPGRGTYGGIDLRDVALDIVDRFVEEIDATLTREGARRISITAAPFVHDPVKSTMLFHSLTGHGYAVETSELDFAVAIDEEELLSKMRRNNRKRLRKCQRSAFSFVQCSFREAKIVYDVIAQNRTSKGFPLSMSFEQVMQMVEHFPDQLFLFGVHEGNSMIAGGICLRLNPQVLYTAYWGDLPGYERFSPVTLLADGIYRFARDNGYRLLDTGTAPDTEHGRGLIRFKENLGCKASLKLTYGKTL